MPDYTGLTKAIKQATIDAMEASKPMKLYYGTVISISPLKISVEQKMTLTAAQLVLTKAVTDYTVDIQVNHVTENASGGSGEASFASHNHAYTGRKQIKIYNGLKNGEKVLLMRFQEGQSFVVLDRVCNHTTEGEWK